MQVMRYHKGDDLNARNPSLFTMNTDGSDLVQCFSREQWSYKGEVTNAGNHPNWHPDGRRIVMNCVPKWLGDDEVRICTFGHDGGDFRVAVANKYGGGHPTIHPSDRFAVTDAYTKERYTVADDLEIPIRFFDIGAGEEHILFTISTDVGGGGVSRTDLDKKIGGSPHKLDPHPAWNRDYTQLCLNGAPDGRRQVFIADLEELVG